MIPVAALVRWRHRGGRRYSLWLPLFVLWLLLLPLALVALPFAILALAVAGARPLKTLAALFRFVAAFPGTRIDIESASAVFVIKIF